MASIISAGTTSGTALNMAGDTSGELQIATNGSTTAVTISTAQNVGIGTTTPTSGKLVVIGSGSASSIMTNRVEQFNGGGNAFTIGDDGTDVLIGPGNSGSNMSLLSRSGGVYTKALIVDSSGNVGIGIAAVDSRVHLYKTVASGDVLKVQNATGSTGVAYIGFKYGTGTGTETGYIGTNGTTTSYNTSSDYRLKEDVKPMVGALDTIAQLKPVTYKWKLDNSASQGFIAHELQEVVPDCVSGEKDAVNEDGSIKPQGIDTSFLVATLTAAIQEQQTIINDLKARITALEGAA